MPTFKQIGFDRRHSTPFCLKVDPKRLKRDLLKFLSPRSTVEYTYSRRRKGSLPDVQGYGQYRRYNGKPPMATTLILYIPSQSSGSEALVQHQESVSEVQQMVRDEV